MYYAWNVTVCEKSLRVIYDLNEYVNSNLSFSVFFFYFYLFRSFYLLTRSSFSLYISSYTLYYYLFLKIFSALLIFSISRERWSFFQIRIFADLKNVLLRRRQDEKVCRISQTLCESVIRFMLIIPKSDYRQINIYVHMYSRKNKHTHLRTHLKKHTLIYTYKERI